jgi:predicted RNase H-like HicB family nuclease
VSSHYTYRARWSPEDGEYVGLCAEFPSLSWLSETAHEAIAGIEALVADVVEDMRRSGEPIPRPLTERTYSGRFGVRTSPDVHESLSIEAAEQGVSLNQLVNLKLAGACK